MGKITFLALVATMLFLVSCGDSVKKDTGNTGDTTDSGDSTDTGDTSDTTPDGCAACATSHRECVEQDGSWVCAGCLETYYETDSHLYEPEKDNGKKCDRDYECKSDNCNGGICSK